jgi:hypothetical protein
LRAEHAEEGQDANWWTPTQRLKRRNRGEQCTVTMRTSRFAMIDATMAVANQNNVVQDTSRCAVDTADTAEAMVSPLCLLRFDKNDDTLLSTRQLGFGRLAGWCRSASRSCAHSSIPSG